jgi:hypothetical protein
MRRRTIMRRNDLEMLMMTLEQLCIGLQHRTDKVRAGSRLLADKTTIPIPEPVRVIALSVIVHNRANGPPDALNRRL